MANKGGTPIIFNDTTVEMSPENFVVVRERTTQMLFDRIPFKPSTAAFKSGELTKPVHWDGLTCNQTQLSLFLHNETASINLNFNSRGSSVSNLTLATWLKLNSRFGNLPDTSLLRLTGLDSKRVYLEIAIEANSLRCKLYSQDGIV